MLHYLSVMCVEMEVKDIDVWMWNILLVSCIWILVSQLAMMLFGHVVESSRVEERHPGGLGPEAW